MRWVSPGPRPKPLSSWTTERSWNQGLLSRFSTPRAPDAYTDFCPKFCDGAKSAIATLSGTDIGLDSPSMADSESTSGEVTELAEGLHRALSKLFSILRRGDPPGGAGWGLARARL